MNTMDDDSQNDKISIQNIIYRLIFLCNYVPVLMSLHLTLGFGHNNCVGTLIDDVDINTKDCE